MAAVFNASATGAAQHQLRDGDAASLRVPPSPSHSAAAAANDVSVFATDNAGDAEAQVDSPSLLHPEDPDDHHARADGGPDKA